MTIQFKLTLIAFSVVLSSHGGDIAGRVTLKGAPPPERSIDLKSYVSLAANYPNGLTTRHYQTSKDGGLRHALVYVRGSFDNVKFEPSRIPPVLDHVDGLFQPYVTGIQVGQELLLKCSDGTACNFHTFSKTNRIFSAAMGLGTVRRIFTEPEVPVRFKCDLHPWNYAYVGVFAHPYFAVTDEDGRFIIRDVPAGQYGLEVFHPKSGTNTQTVLVTDKAITLNFEMRAK